MIEWRRGVWFLRTARVEWGFLERVMLQMGFNCHWVALIVECVTTTFYHVLIEG